MVVQVYHPTYWAQLFLLIDCILPTCGVNNADKKVLWYPCSIHIQNTECVRYPCILSPQKIFTLECLGAEYFSKNANFHFFSVYSQTNFVCQLHTSFDYSSSKSWETQMHCRLYRPFLGLFYGTLSIFLAERSTFAYRTSHVFWKLFI